jgi:hypothetical protein
MKLHRLPLISAKKIPAIPIAAFRNPLILLGGILLCLLTAPAARAQGVTFSYAQTTLLYSYLYIGSAVDSNGNVFLANYSGGDIEELVAVGGSIPANPTTPNIVATGFSYPRDVKVDGSGNIFVADGGNNAVKEILAVNGSIPADPTIRTLGSGFDSPSKVALDSAGDVFVADSGNNAVKEILAVNGSIPADPTIRTLGSGFKVPAGLAVDGSGNVFIADDENSAIKEILAVNGSVPADPTIRVLAGSLTYQPSPLALDAKGDVFYGSYFNLSVQEILAVNGSIPAENPTTDALGTLDNLEGISTDQNGNVFVTASDVSELQLGAVNFGGVNACTASQISLNLCGPEMIVTLTYNVAPETTIGGVNILTGGVTNLDFRESARYNSTPCSTHTYHQGGPCTVIVAFAPLAPGVRNGSVEIVDGDGNPLVTTALSGLGPNQTVAFPAIPAQIAGTSVALVATASSSLPLTFASLTPTICTVTGNTATLLAAGYCNVEAFQPGNAQYFAAVADRAFLVHHANQTIDFPTLVPQVALAQFYLPATVSSNLPLTFSTTTPEVCTVTDLNLVKLFIAGYCDVIVTQPGNAEYFAAVTGQTFLVHHRHQILTFNPIAAHPVGTTFTLDATSQSPLPIAFASITPEVCTVSGSTASLLTTGTCTVQASQAGNATYFSAGPITRSFTVE